MKKTLFVLLTVLICLGLASIAMAGVSGTPHDPRVFPNLGASFVCESCHTPHAAQTYPLWNRNRNGSTLTFAMYNSPTFDESLVAATYTAGGYLGYQSKLCFACHDGALSTIQFVPAPDVAGSYDITILDTNKTFGNDLRNTHPVGFLVNIALDYNGGGRSGLNTLVVTNRNIQGNSGNNNFPLYPDPSGGTLTQGTFQCATCHTVHNTPDDGYNCFTDGEVCFLRVSNLASNMCAECHPLYYW